MIVHPLSATMWAKCLFLFFIYSYHLSLLRHTFQVDNWVRYIVLHGICYLISGRHHYYVVKEKKFIRHLLVFFSTSSGDQEFYSAMSVFVVCLWGVMYVAALLHDIANEATLLTHFLSLKISLTFSLAGIFTWVAVHRACLDPSEQCCVMLRHHDVGTLLFGQYSPTCKNLFFELERI